jgi:sec-independent protein translocase protein TatA
MFRNPVTDLVIVLVVALLIFGPKRLPLLGRSLGQGLREFKDSITGDSKDDDDEERPALTPASAAPSPASTVDPVPTAADSTPASASPEPGSSEVRTSERPV